MSERVVCPSCGATLRVPESARGRKVRCSRCRQPVAVGPPPAADPRALAQTLRREPDGPAAPPAGADDRAVAETRRDAGPAAPPGPAARDTHADAGPAPYRVRSPDEEREPPPLGRVGRFELRAALGQGTFGRVYRAYDPALDREVALKVPRRGGDRAEGERFLEEARAAARLRHPNIVAVFDVGQADGQSFIASELVDGQPLSAVLAQERPDFRRAAGWVRDLALALHYAHGQGIVHRDVKPANVLIDRHGRAQLMDFGLAKRAGGTPDGAADEGRVGTPAYMAPEPAGGALADQYSLGVVLYEMLTGRLPYTGTPAAVLARSADPRKRPPRPRKIDPEIPLDLEAICLAAMAKQAMRRYPSAGELAADLQRWLAGEPIRARSLGRLERALLWYRRHRTLAVAGVLTAVILLAGAALAAGYFLHRRGLEQAQRQAEEQFAKDKERAEGEARAAADKARREHEERLRSECRLYQERGLRQCEGGKPGDGVLLLGEAFARAVEAGDEGLQRAVADDLVAWVPKLDPPDAQVGARRALYERAARRLLGLAPAAAEPAGADEGVARILGIALPDTAGTKAVAFRADGQTLVTGDGRGLSLWDVATARRRGPPRPASLPPGAPLSADGQAYVTGDGTPDQLRVRDTATGEPRGEAFKPIVGGVAGVSLSPDGKRVVVRGGGWGRLFDAVSGQSLGPKTDSDWHVGIVLWSTDSTRFADFKTVNEQQLTAEVWDAATGDRRRRESPLLNVADRPDRTTPPRARVDQTPALAGGPWDARLDVLPGVHHRYPYSFTCLAISPDGRHVLTAGGPKVRVWDPATGRPLDSHWEDFPDGVTDLTFSPDGKLVAVCTGNAVRVRRMATGRPFGQPLVGASPAVRALFSPDGKTVVAVHHDLVYLWPASTDSAAVGARSEGVRLWLQVLTGRELGDGEKARPLDEAARKERRERLEGLLGVVGPGAG
jgi:hypothetical protein